MLTKQPNILPVKAAFETEQTMYDISPAEKRETATSVQSGC